MTNINLDTNTTATTQLKQARVVGFDIARTVAIFGMIIVNYSFVVVTIGESDTNFFSVIVGLLSGRAAATFVVLAGVGASLASARARLSNDKEQISNARTRLLKRALFLLIIGYLWFWSGIWSGDILHFYGVYLIFGALLLTMRDRFLWLTAVLVAIGGLIYFLTGDFLSNWNNNLSYTNYWNFAQVGFLKELFLNGLHPIFPWVALYIYGMWLGRRDFSKRRTLIYIALTALAVVFITELVGTLVAGKFPDINQLITSGYSWTSLFATFPVPPSLFYLLASAGTATLVIVASLLIGRAWGNLLPIKVLVSTGQLALTIYIAHVFIGLYPLLLVVEGFGISTAWRLPAAFIASVLFIAVALTFSYFWHKNYKRGPMEALMRLFSDRQWVRKQQPQK